MNKKIIFITLLVTLCSQPTSSLLSRRITDFKTKRVSRKNNPFGVSNLIKMAEPAEAADIPEKLLPQPLPRLEKTHTASSSSSGGFVDSENKEIIDLNNRPVAEDEYTADLFGDQKNQSGDEKDIILNFKDADLEQFIEYIGKLRNIKLIPNKSIRGNKISLSLRNPVTKDGAWQVFLTLLDMADYTTVKRGEFHEVLPKAHAKKNPLPTFIGVAPESLPDSDAIIRYLVFLNNIPTQEVSGILRSLLSPQSLVLEQPQVNGMIITDNAYHIKAAMKVIHELDQTGMEETVLVMPLKQANARDVKHLFDGLISRTDGNPLARLLGKKAEASNEYFSPTTRMIVEDRTNSLILMGNRKSLEKVQKFIVEHIDKSLKEAESPLKVYELQHTNAEEIVEILNEITNPQNYQSEAGQQAARYGAVRGGVKYFKNIQFKADRSGNRILVSTTDPHDWELIQKTIRDLDRAQPQVAVDMMFATVNANTLRELGGQFRNKEHNMFGRNIDFQSHPVGSSNTFGQNQETGAISLLGNLIGGLAGKQGSTLLTLGQTITSNNIWAIFRALREEKDASVTTHPSLIVANRTRGNLSFGDTKLVVTQKAVGQQGSIGDASGRKPVEAFTNITVLPQINVDGIIKMDIDIGIKEFLDEAGNQMQSKTLKTSATVANGQVLVLGGFVKTKITEGSGKTPILGDIPILGWLAKNQSRSITKEYIFIFISPTIIKPRSTPGVDPYTRIKLHQARQDVREAIQTKKVSDPVHNWFFNPDGYEYEHKITDFANARYQPTTVDIKNDPFYRSDKSVTQPPQVLDFAPSESSSPQQYTHRPYHQKVLPKKIEDDELEKAVLASLQKEKERLMKEHEESLAAETAKRKTIEQELNKLKEEEKQKIALKEEESAKLDEEIRKKREKFKKMVEDKSLFDIFGQAPDEKKQRKVDVTEKSIAPIKDTTTKEPLLHKRNGLKRFLALPDEEIELSQNSFANQDKHVFNGKKNLKRFLSKGDVA